MTNQAAPESPLVDMMQELAAGLRQSIQEVPLDYIAENPEDAYIDLACRLVFAIRGKLEVVPTRTTEERVRSAHADAACRIFDIFTRWMNHERSFTARVSESGRFQVVVKTPTTTQLFFGQTIQDAYAQAAQVLSFRDLR